VGSRLTAVQVLHKCRGLARARSEIAVRTPLESATWATAGRRGRWYFIDIFFLAQVRTMTVINNRISVANDWKAEMEAKRAFLQELIKNDDLDEAALEITKQVIAEGENSLTPAQKFAFQRNVLRKFVTQKCQNGCDISWSEQYEALLNGGFCFYCYYGMTNYRDE
jgi:hypothetical protein